MSKRSKAVYGRSSTKWTPQKDNNMLVKIDYISSLLKNPPQMKKEGHDQFIAGFCPSVSICMLLNIQII